VVVLVVVPEVVLVAGGGADGRPPFCLLGRGAGIWRSQGHRCFSRGCGHKKQFYLFAWRLLGLLRACCSDALPLFSVCFKLDVLLFIFLAFLAFFVAAAMRCLVSLCVSSVLHVLREGGRSTTHA
jgi:hypothetical protein